MYVVHYILLRILRYIYIRVDTYKMQIKKKVILYYFAFLYVPTYVRVGKTKMNAKENNSNVILING